MSNPNLDNLYRQVIIDHYKHPRNKGTFEDDKLTVEMNNPTYGDRICLQFKRDNDIVSDIKFTGEGCSISMASASMMTESVKGKTVEEALELADLFSQMMMGNEVDIGSFDMDDIEALQGVAEFPARIKCATLAWKAMERVDEFEN